MTMNFLKSPFRRFSQNNLLRLSTIFNNVAPLRCISSAPQRFNPYGSFYPTQQPRALVDVTTSSLHVIEDFTHYESLVYSMKYLCIFFFISTYCNWSKVLQPCFQKRVREYQQQKHQTVLNSNGSQIPHLFAEINVDSCPRAAYHCDIDDVPSIVIMYGDDAFRKKVVPENRYDASNLLDQAFEILREFDRTPIQEIQSLSSPLAWFDHHIRRDNLNLNRVVWPLHQ
ncbi:uncharacterized protein LOC128883173 [Hylaeus volcanicus]|uniref:uncharacterized protein LOC128883173 n=1 Tax=Hylaeus volcanicus TaxID=313075 RepID=UPI0023B7D513|nr:uncharacterized protein LOC128883173 [Hylaeus volcanicus]XP_053991229.1 uncharacterized protein LOC128883173 [Hylaeus volcanicus]XP_053991230.1 uncharacterized protein LOC128883173 [Hylaeus volcanicus]